MSRRQLPAWALLVTLLAAPGLAGASQLKVEGTIDVPPFGPGGSLAVPLASGAPPVQVLVSFGQPPIQLAVFVDSSTWTAPSSLVLVDGMPVEIYAAVELGQFFKAYSIKRDYPDELEVRGTVSGLPPGGVTLPVPAGEGDVTLRLESSSIAVTLHIDAFTGVSPEPLLIVDGDQLKVTGTFRDGRVVASHLEVVGP